MLAAACGEVVACGRIDKVRLIQDAVLIEILSGIDDAVAVDVFGMAIREQEVVVRLEVVAEEEPR